MLCLCSCCYAVIRHPQPLSLPAPKKHSTKLRGVTHIQMELSSWLKIRWKGGGYWHPNVGLLRSWVWSFVFGKHTLNDTRQQEFIKERLLYFGWFYELSKKLVIWGGVVARWFLQISTQKDTTPTCYWWDLLHEGSLWSHSKAVQTLLHPLLP